MSTAWVTLATTDGYAIGALVLAQSLRNVHTTHRLHALCTADVSVEMRDQLRAAFDEVTEVNVMDSYDAENLALIGRPDLGVTFTKLHCWRLTQYSKCVFLDADTFEHLGRCLQVLKNCDELFDHPEISAAPDIGWPDYFNSGVFVFVPSQTTYQNLLQFALAERSFDGGDQGLLNKFFSGWRESDVSHRLSFLYNVTANAIYSYAAAIKRHAADIKIIHFLGKDKPWHASTSTSHVVSQHLQEWQKTYTEAVQRSLPISLVSGVKHFPCCHTSPDWIQTQVKRKEEESNLLYQHAVSTIQKRIAEEALPIIGFQLRQMQSGTAQAKASQPAAAVGEKEQRYEAWEQGKPDYEGNDAFANIQKAIEKSLQ